MSKEFSKNVNLSEFISDSLKQIIDGVVSAQVYAKTKGALINPADSHVEAIEISTPSGEAYFDDDERTYRKRETIEFDIAVSVADEEKIEGGFAVIAAVISTGTKGSARIESEAISRLKFSIPVFFPIQKD